MGSKMVVRILSSSLALILSAMLCSTLTFGAVDVAKESGSGSLTSVDFGEVAVGSSSQEQLVVTNTNAELIDLRFTLSYGSSCVVTLLTPSIVTDVGAYQTANVTLEYEALEEGTCSGSFYIIYTGQTSGSTAVTPLPMEGIGVPPEEVPKNPVSNVLIDGQDTDILDFVWKDGRTATEWFDECAGKARNHGEYMRCMALLTRRMHRDGLLTEEGRQAIRKAAAHANIPKRKSGLEDLEYNGESVTDLIKECKENANSRREYRRCIRDLIRDLKEDGVIETWRAKREVLRHAARLSFHGRHSK